MAMSAARLCSKCRKVKPCGCVVRQDSSRESAARRGYGHKWREWRLWYLKRHPLCVDCQSQEGRTEPATEPHHIIKVADAPELMTSEQNLMPLCKRHHSIRTKRGE